MQLNYTAVGATRIAVPVWAPDAPGFRAYERTVRIGSGDATWRTAAADVLAWEVKTRSGFEVNPASGGDIAVRVGAAYALVARIGPLAVREPVEVVAMVDGPDRCGFAYGTGIGHPVSGEEAFIVSRDAAGEVWLTLRSLTRPSAGRWRVLLPLILVAQRWYRFRYAGALRRAPLGSRHG